jgi:hypothetical protein
VSPVYFSNGVVCPKISSQQIDIAAKTNASFEIYATQDEFEGILLFKLQKYVEPDDQGNMDALTIEPSENDAKCVQMFALWKVKDSEPFAQAKFVEHTKELTWDEDKLRKLYNMNCDYLVTYNGTISNKWLVDDNVTLGVAFRTRILEGNFELSISISEEEKDAYSARPLHVDLKR